MRYAKEKVIHGLIMKRNFRLNKSGSINIAEHVIMEFKVLLKVVLFGSYGTIITNVKINIKYL